ncbi:unnamed protein product [Clavelina lepadiformis]|uniref:Uncharacterized protein n=1 Tax=Clavelina lepadiformis TaxID=159417 RepID=A0ABP0F1I1_CLALP
MAEPSAPPAYNDVVYEKDRHEQTQPYPPQTQPYPSGPPQPTTYPQGYSPVNQPYPSEGAFHQPMYQSAPPPETHNPTADGEGFTVGSSFDDKTVRRLFIRKVFLTLGLQLLVTFGIVCVFTFIPAVGEFVRKYPGFYYAAFGVFFVLYIILVCCGNVRRKHPINIVLLIGFTLALSYMVGTIASFYDTKAVVIALGITVGVCLAIVLFSMQTKFDFTKCSGLLFVLSMVLFLFGIITIFTHFYSWYLQVVYASLGALLFTLYLAFDVQLVMGGKRYELDPEEYIYGALNLYIDVVYIFLFILQIVGLSNN